MDEEIGRAGPDAELFVIRDRRVKRVQGEKQIRHHGSMAERRFECIGTKRLAPQRPVHVRDDKEHELDVLGRPELNR